MRFRKDYTHALVFNFLFVCLFLKRIAEFEFVRHLPWLGLSLPSAKMSLDDHRHPIAVREMLRSTC